MVTLDTRGGFTFVRQRILLLELPAEILRMIALNLRFDDLVHFQKSSRTAVAATSDVSFYYRFFTRHHARRAIKEVYSNRERIPNWKDVIRRLYNDPAELAFYFCDFEYHYLYKSGRTTVLLPDCELELLGHKLGNLFAKTNDELKDSSYRITIQDLNRIIDKLWAENPELAETKQGRVFKDIFLHGILNFILVHRGSNIETLKDVDLWVSALNFATENKLTLYQQKMLHHIVISIISRINEGSIDYDTGIWHLSYLIPQLHSMERIGYFMLPIDFKNLDSLPRHAKVIRFLFQEIVGKRRPNYGVFFNNFVLELAYFLALFVKQNEFVQEHLDILRDVLKWRPFVSNEDWRRFTLRTSLIILAVVDETLRDIIFDKGFVLDDSIRCTLLKMLGYNCSEKFREICEDHLSPSEYAGSTDQDETIYAP